VGEAIDRLLALGLKRIFLVPVLTGGPHDQVEASLADELARRREEHPEVEFALVQTSLDPDLHAQLLLSALQGEVCVDAEEEAVPLSALSTAESGTVHCLNGGHDLVSRLSALGFVPGSPLQIVQNYQVGPLIVSVRGTRIALGREEARRVKVCRSGRRRPRRRVGRRHRHWARRRHE
jgi:ferrous iron transport protein A